MTDNLHFHGGSRDIRYRFDIIRNQSAIGTLPVISATISNDSTATIKRTMQLECGEPEDINWISDRIRAVMIVCPHNKSTWGDALKNTWGTVKGKTWNSLKGDEEEYPIGIFVPSSPKLSAGVGKTYEVDCYDLSVIPKEDCITDPLYIAAGTNYVAEVEALLAGCGIVSVISEPTEYNLLADREFEAGKSKIEIINTLLGEINYADLWVRSDGTFMVQPYAKSGVPSVKYSSGDNSVISVDSVQTTDYFSVPNVFIACVSSPDSTPIYAKYTNDNPASPLSTIQRGRKVVSQLYKPDAIQSQEELDKYIERIAYDASQVSDEISFTTAAMPGHENGTIISIDHPDLSGIYKESSWSISIEDRTMQHAVKKVVDI